MLRILLYGVLFPISLNIAYTSIHRHEKISRLTSFCEERRAFSNYFPMDNPEPHIPWVWEAVYDPMTKLIDITTLTRRGCEFNYTLWKIFYESRMNNSEFQRQFAFGKIANILVPVDELPPGGQSMPPEKVQDDVSIINNVFHCVFCDDDGLVLATTESHRVTSATVFARFSTIQIRCPAPAELLRSQWSTLRVERSYEAVSSFQYDRKHYSHSISNTTRRFSVCDAPVYDPINKVHDLAICTATDRGDRQEMVEWLEYNRLMGVDHFFIYNTAVKKDGSGDSDLALNNLLKDYVAEGLVTIIPWPYMNCARYMASGRQVEQEFLEQRTDVRTNRTYWKAVKHSFQPPRAIAQTAALASCYSRFRHTTKYMMHIDDDEFFTFSRDLLLSKWMETSVRSVASGVDGGEEARNKPIVRLADEIFSQYKQTAAIVMPYMIIHFCNSDRTLSISAYKREYRRSPSTAYGCVTEWASEDGTMSDGGNRSYSDAATVGETAGQKCFKLPPRLHKRYDMLGLPEGRVGKLIMRTDYVGMFFTHFVTLQDSRPGFDVYKFNQLEIYDPYPKHKSIANLYHVNFDLRLQDASLMHFKTPHELAATIFGPPSSHETCSNGRGIQARLYFQRNARRIRSMKSEKELSPSELETLHRTEGGVYGASSKLPHRQGVVWRNGTWVRAHTYIPPSLLRELNIAFKSRIDAYLHN